MQGHRYVLTSHWADLVHIDASDRVGISIRPVSRFVDKLSPCKVQKKHSVFTFRGFTGGPCASNYTNVECHVCHDISGVETCSRGLWRIQRVLGVKS